MPGELTTTLVKSTTWGKVVRLKFSGYRFTNLAIGRGSDGRLCARRRRLAEGDPPGRDAPHGCGRNRMPATGGLAERWGKILQRPVQPLAEGRFQIALDTGAMNFLPGETPEAVLAGIELQVIDEHAWRRRGPRLHRCGRPNRYLRRAFPPELRLPSGEALHVEMPALSRAASPTCRRSA